MEILTIDGAVMPTPDSYKVQLSDLDSSGTGRTEDGVLVRERVRGGVAKNQFAVVGTLNPGVPGC